MTGPSGSEAIGFATAQVHAGAEPADRGARVAPIFQSAGFAFDGVDDASARFRDNDLNYTRTGNPTTRALERRVAALEGGTSAVAVASGQAAVVAALLGLLRAGDRLVSSARLYGGTLGLFQENLAALGIETDTVADSADPAAWAAAIGERTRAVFVESISNPDNEVVDLAALAAVAHERGVALVVDNTLATPYLLRPLEHGADVVVHSASKYLSGHGSVIAGVVVDGGTVPSLSRYAELDGAGAYGALLRDSVAPRFGASLGPFDAFLVAQGIETLSLRVDRQSANALDIAAWLEGLAEVERVDYAGLASSPSAAVAARLLPRGAGGVLAVTFTGGEPEARRIVERLRLFTHMTSLGDVRSLAIHPATTTHLDRTEAERAHSGVSGGTLRLSIGIEDVADLRADLAQAIEARA